MTVMFIQNKHLMLVTFWLDFRQKLIFSQFNATFTDVQVLDDAV